MFSKTVWAGAKEQGAVDRRLRYWRFEQKTVGVVEKFRIHCLDEIVAYLSRFMGQAKSRACNFELVGSAYDLTAAYKQFGVCEHDRELLRLAVVNTDENRISLMGLNSLPFGAVVQYVGFFEFPWQYGFWALHNSI